MQAYVHPLQLWRDTVQMNEMRKNFKHLKQPVETFVAYFNAAAN